MGKHNFGFGHISQTMVTSMPWAVSSAVTATSRLTAAEGETANTTSYQTHYCIKVTNLDVVVLHLAQRTWLKGTSSVELRGAPEGRFTGSEIRISTFCQPEACFTISLSSPCPHSYCVFYTSLETRMLMLPYGIDASQSRVRLTGGPIDDHLAVCPSTPEIVPCFRCNIECAFRLRHLAFGVRKS